MKQQYMKKSELDWMEWHAEKLPAYVSMAKETTVRVIEEELSKRGGVRSPENMQAVLARLMSVFRVSKSMARIRMKELGYEEAEGICNFMDHTPIPDHGCSGVWPKGIRYTISPSEVQNLISTSDLFLFEMNSGKYAYAEGHLCLNHPNYLEYNQWMQPRLTDYARHHIDKCCIGFSVHGINRQGNYQNGVAARLREKKKSMYGNLRMSSVPGVTGTEEWDRDVDLTISESELWADIMFHLPNDFRGALNYVRRERGISSGQLAARLGISYSYYNKMLKGPISKAHLVGICVTLRSRIDVSLRLMELSGNNLTSRGADRLYMTMLINPEEYDIQLCNAVLEEEGYGRLFPQSRSDVNQ